MIIAITATGDNKQAEVDSRFGRAAYFLIIDTDTKEFRVHNNQDGVNAANGAGTVAAQLLAEQGVSALYTGGRVGPKAAEVLNRAQISYYENISGTVQSVLDQVKQGPLAAAAGNTAEPGRDTMSAAPGQCVGAAPGTRRGLGRGGGRGLGRGQGRGGGGRGRC